MGPRAERATLELFCCDEKAIRCGSLPRCSLSPLPLLPVVSTSGGGPLRAAAAARARVSPPCQRGPFSFASAAWPVVALLFQSALARVARVAPRLPRPAAARRRASSPRATPFLGPLAPSAPSRRPAPRAWPARRAPPPRPPAAPAGRRAAAAWRRAPPASRRAPPPPAAASARAPPRPRPGPPAAAACQRPAAARPASPRAAAALRASGAAWAPGPLAPATSAAPASAGCAFPAPARPEPPRCHRQPAAAPRARARTRRRPQKALLAPPRPPPPRPPPPRPPPPRPRVRAAGLLPGCAARRSTQTRAQQPRPPPRPRPRPPC